MTSIDLNNLINKYIFKFELFLNYIDIFLFKLISLVYFIYILYL